MLQVEDKGQAWYVSPKDGARYYLANGDDAFQIMKSLGVGISNKDLEKIKTDTNYRKKFIGKIFLQVESHGEAYYVSFDGRYNYLKNGAAAYEVMRKLGLGISNKNLDSIKISYFFKNPNYKTWTSGFYSLSECLSFLKNNIDWGSDCYVSEAVRTKNLIICDNLPNLLKGAVHGGDYCYRQVGVANLDLKICDQSGNFRDVCYSDISTATNDLALCQGIPSQDGGPRDGCIGYFAEKRIDSSLCQEVLNSYERFQCYVRISEQTGNISLCENIQDDAQKEFCRVNKK